MKLPLDSFSNDGQLPPRMNTLWFYELWWLCEMFNLNLLAARSV
jgi:hypothetical protein